MGQAERYPIIIVFEVLVAFAPVFLLWAISSMYFVAGTYSVLFVEWNANDAYLSYASLAGGIGLLGLLKLVKLVLRPKEQNWSIRSIVICFCFGLSALAVAASLNNKWIIILPVMVSLHLFYLARENAERNS